MSNNIYQIADDIGRDKVIKCINNNHLHFTDIKPAEDDFCHYDISAKTADGKINFIEVKDRDFDSDKYPDTMIEQFKFITNVNIAKQYNGRSILAVLYTDNVCRMWNLSSRYDKGEYRYGEVFCRKATVEDRGKVVKKMVYFDNNKAFGTYKI